MGRRGAYEGTGPLKGLMSPIHMTVDGYKVRPPAFLSSSSLGCFFSASPTCHDFDPKGSSAEDKMMILDFYFPKYTITL